MKLKLGDKIYEQTKFKGRILRNALEIQGILEIRQEENKFTTEELDLMCEFLANTFNGQFTSDEVLDELEFFEIVSEFRNVVREVMNKTHDKMKKLEKK